MHENTDTYLWYGFEIDVRKFSGIVHISMNRLKNVQTYIPPQRNTSTKTAEILYINLETSIGFSHCFRIPSQTDEEY